MNLLMALLLLTLPFNTLSELRSLDPVPELVQCETTLVWLHEVETPTRQYTAYVGMNNRGVLAEYQGGNLKTVHKFVVENDTIRIVGSEAYNPVKHRRACEDWIDRPTT